MSREMLCFMILLWQRREYKSKFLENETEYSRLKERLETMNMMLDDMQVEQMLHNILFIGCFASL